MNITKITQSEINRAKISSLPTRPNSSSAFGGAGFSSKEMKEAFDRLPLLITEKLNCLIEALDAEGESNICESIKTPLTDYEGNALSLRQILCDMMSGDMAAYLGAGSGKSLASALEEKAPLASPSFSGCPTAPTPSSTADDSSRIATTAWVHDVTAEIDHMFEQIRNGVYGHVPAGGETGDVLCRSGSYDRGMAWVSLSDYDFSCPTAETQSPGDNTNKVATTAFVKAAIDALKGGVEDAYDTLEEISAALQEGNGEICRALELIASKDNRTVFETFRDSATLTPAAHHEYRAEEPLCSMTLTLPLYPQDDYICALDFTTSSALDMSYSYTDNPQIYSTGDDCTDGVFIPIRGKHYTWVLWYSGGKYQGVVRRSE